MPRNWVLAFSNVGIACTCLTNLYREKVVALLIEFNFPYWLSVTLLALTLGECI